jgi:hypothetical protein
MPATSPAAQDPAVGAVGVPAHPTVPVGVVLQVPAVDVGELADDGVVLEHGDLQAVVGFWSERAL